MAKKKQNKVVKLPGFIVDIYTIHNPTLDTLDKTARIRMKAGTRISDQEVVAILEALASGIRSKIEPQAEEVQL